MCPNSLNPVSKQSCCPNMSQTSIILIRDWIRMRDVRRFEYGWTLRSEIHEYSSCWHPRCMKMFEHSSFQILDLLNFEQWSQIDSFEFKIYVFGRRQSILHTWIALITYKKTNPNGLKKLSMCYWLVQKHFEDLESNELVDDDDGLPLFDRAIKNCEQIHHKRS